MKYFVKTPWWLKKIYPSYTWDIKTDQKVIYLTFDDGPHETATVFVLDELKKYDAKASFFCVGSNVTALPELYDRIISEGHAIGNHTYSHMNGWRSNDQIYLDDVAKAGVLIKSEMFRPPYGRIKSFQAANISRIIPAAKIIMWSVLSGDFDNSITKEQCLENVILNTNNGSIIVFHDSEKALSLLQYALPRTLEYYAKNGYRFESLEKVVKV